MKKLLLIALLAGSIGVMRANSYTYSVGSALPALDHSLAYTWGLNNATDPISLSRLNTDIAHGMEVLKARIEISGLYDWTVEDDILYIDLLDNPTYAGVSHFGDTAPDDYFKIALTPKWSAREQLTFWQDPKGGSSHAINYFYDLTEAQCDTLTGYLKSPRGTAGANFGLGFDPDCHYYHGCVKLKIQTGCPVPDGGATLLLVGLGLIAIPGLKRLLRA